jgi:quercetin dioxygenase-like cupin family protein
MTDMLGLEDSGGVLALADSEMPAGREAAAPDHEASDHGYYVIGGQLTLRLSDEPTTVGKGAFAFAPQGVPHTIANETDAPARYVLIEAPVREAGPDLGAKIVEHVSGRVKVLLRGADSGGRLAVMDNVVPAGAQGPPLHYHDFDEAFYILAGEATFRLGDELVTRGPGELVFAPRGAHPRIRQPERRGHPLAPDLRARGLRALLPANGRGGGGRRPAARGTRALARGGRSRPAHRRVVRRRSRQRGSPPTPAPEAGSGGPCVECTGCR